MILLTMSCGKGVPTSPSDDTVQQDIWCELNFKLKIKANPASDEDLERYRGTSFTIRAYSYCQIQNLGEIRIDDPAESIEKELKNISDFKTGDNEYRFELCYQAHSSPYPLASSLSMCGDTFDINLQITSITSGVVVSPESFSTTWTCGLGDRKTFKFLLSR